MKLTTLAYTIVPTEVDKNARQIANVNDCAVPFSRSAAANLCWYYYITTTISTTILLLFSTSTTTNLIDARALEIAVISNCFTSSTETLTLDSRADLNTIIRDGLASAFLFL